MSRSPRGSRPTREASVDAGPAEDVGSGSLAAGILPAILLLAAGLRWIAWQRTVVMFNDGPIFLALAKRAAAGDWEGLISHDYHPLYPLAIAGTQALFGPDDPWGWEQPAVAVSILGGTLAVAACFVFLRSAFGPGIAAIGATLLAIHPYAVRYSADVQSDGLHLGLFMTAVALGWLAIARRSPPWGFAAGLASGLAYLVRPEGIGVAIASIGALGLLALGGWLRPARAAGLAVAVAAGAAIAAGPYVWLIRGDSDPVQLTQKKRLEQVAPVAEWSDRLRGAFEVGSADGEPAPAIGNAREKSPLLELGGELKSVMRPELIVLLVVGVVASRGRPGPRAVYAASVFGLYLVVLLGLSFGAGYVSKRHVIGPLMVLIGFVASGVPIVAAWLARLVARDAHRQVGPAAIGSVLLLVACAALPKALKQHRDERIAVREAAEWLAAQPGERGAVGVCKRRDAYYARARARTLPSDGTRSIVGPLRRDGVRYLLVDDEALERFPELSVAGAGLRVLYRADSRDRGAQVIELVGPVEPFGAEEGG